MYRIGVTKVSIFQFFSDIIQNVKNQSINNRKNGTYFKFLYTLNIIISLPCPKTEGKK